MGEKMPPMSGLFILKCFSGHKFLGLSRPSKAPGSVAAKYSHGKGGVSRLIEKDAGRARGFSVRMPFLRLLGHLVPTSAGGGRV